MVRNNLWNRQMPTPVAMESNKLLLVFVIINGSTPIFSVRWLYDGTSLS